MAVGSGARHWTGGRWTGRVDRPSVNPATGDTIGWHADADAEVAQAAIDAARSAFESSGWQHDAVQRARVLHRMADAYEARADDLVATTCLENGKLAPEAQMEVVAVPRALRFAAGLAMHDFGRVLETRPGQQSMSIRQPVGVAGIISPWNGPVYLPIRSLAPALAAGCATVIKVPAQAAQTGALVADILADMPELPAGQVNLFIESGHDGARHLVTSPQVPVISFTGSTATGRRIAAAAAPHLKRVGAELGGKTPHLVFADADLTAAAATAAASCTVFAGQFCMTGSRILVQDQVADRFVAQLAEHLTAVRPGPAADPASGIGPLIDGAAVARVDALVDEALAAGARAVVRGGPATEPDLAAGAFYRPTLLEVDDSAMTIVQDEVFGPVQTVQRFRTEDEAVALANATDYGLSACIWSRDVDRPVRVARRLEAGLISINSWANLTMQMEEGGWKASGYGRLGGVASLDDFTEYKQITQDFAA